MPKYTTEIKVNLSVSIVIPTLNCQAALDQCLSSIQTQNYPKHLIEVIIADAGSKDQTLQVAKKYPTSIYKNALKTGEAGKAVGAKHATCDIIALVDSDNILPTETWLSQMLKPFEDETILASEPLHYTHRPHDHFITRYCALLGMNDPLCHFLGNYDRFNHLTGRWTEVEVKSQKMPGYERIQFLNAQTPTVGANGFCIRKSALDRLEIGDYLNDIDLMPMLIQKLGAGQVAMAKVACGIVHLYCQSVSSFIHKQTRRVQDYLFFSHKKQRVYSWQKQSQKGIFVFILYIILIVPLFFQSLKGFFRKKDVAWFFHPLACWLTFYIYATAVIKARLVKKSSMYAREDWKQG